MLTQKIIEKEFALSGSEQNPDLTGKDLKLLAAAARLRRARPRRGVQAARRRLRGRRHARRTARRHARPLARRPSSTPTNIEREIVARDREVDNEFSKDLQLIAVRGARKYRGDKLIRVATPHRILDPKAGPLIAVKLHILTRKSLGGIQTDLDSRALGADGTPVPGLYAVGEAAGFGGGGVHGYRALEGTFLGGCLFTGRAAGRAIARGAG